MTLVLIAAGLMVGLAVAVFGLALCVTAARADETAARAQAFEDEYRAKGMVPWDELDERRARAKSREYDERLDQYRKRTRGATTPGSMTEDR